MISARRTMALLMQQQMNNNAKAKKGFSILDETIHACTEF